MYLPSEASPRTLDDEVSQSPDASGEVSGSTGATLPKPIPRGAGEGAGDTIYKYTLIKVKHQIALHLQRSQCSHNSNNLIMKCNFRLHRTLNLCYPRNPSSQSAHACIIFRRSGKCSA